mmetsp:Transcript_113346/g.315252  ORF Transcript_113346/g.315252 Transcript_113346/m.315252 type:complete len:93 (-) Transcript_113346:38-316(-)
MELGPPRHTEDVLQHGAVQVAGSKPAGMTQDGVCGEFLDLLKIEGDTMVYWEEGVSDPPKLPVPSVRCLRVVAKAMQDKYVAIQHIQVRSRS